MIAIRGAERHPCAGTGRAGLTLLELLVVLALIGALLAIAIRPLGNRLDRLAVEGARTEVLAALARGREEALARGTAAVAFDSARAAVVVRTGHETVTQRTLGERFGVRLEATRDTLAYDARGLGWGAANLRVVLKRGVARETVVVSRLGRAR